VRLQVKDYVVPEALADQKLPEDVDFPETESPSSEDEEGGEAPAGGAGAPVAAPLPLPVHKDKPDERVIIITSDQKVLLISLRKEKVIGALQNIMKSVSVDCELNQIDNGPDISCLSMGDSIGSFAYHPDLQKDIKETEAKYKVSKVLDSSRQ
jgi:hypothetical protein